MPLYAGDGASDDLQGAKSSTVRLPAYLPLRARERAILKTVLAMPFMTVKVVAGILFEAARLWWKKIPVHRHPGERPTRITMAHNEDRIERIKAA